MSTYIESSNAAVIHSESDLEAYFFQGMKSREQAQVGIEVEFLGVDARTGKAIPYSGAQGIEAILHDLARRHAYEKVLERGRVIALRKNRLLISLEPGGQIELSALPARNICEVEKQILNFTQELRSLREGFPAVRFLAFGIQPFSRVEEIEWVPKARYDVMADYLGARGDRAHWMMKMTAADQISFDYFSEEEAMTGLRLVNGLTSIVSAMFAHSCFLEGRPSGFLSHRIEIWERTDPQRSGLLVRFLDKGRRFGDFLEYLLDLPMLFIVRGTQWFAIGGKCNFREFIRKGFEGMQPTWDDFELHVSTAFPEVRLKKYIEIRGTDGQSLDLIPAVAALWKGLLYDEASREAAWDLVSFAKAEDLLVLRRDIARQGVQAKLKGRDILPIAQALVALAGEGLRRLRGSVGCEDESRYLERIREKILGPRMSPAESLLRKWKCDMKQEPQALIDYLSIG
ncbi:MAG: glutamate--cysteine ligase [Candidatus Omnitrophota bacterium]